VAGRSPAKAGKVMKVAGKAHAVKVRAVKAPVGKARRARSAGAGGKAEAAGKVNGHPTVVRGGDRGTGSRSIGRATMKRSFVIPSDYDAIRQVLDPVMADVAVSRYDSDTTFAIRISLEEALVNAIKHGNREDRHKTVRVESDVTPARAEIVIEDEGPGFDRRHVPDPTAVENLCRPSGRGILLIESYMTDVKWERGGRRVRMVKRNGAAA
jgi:serine/threonine-protein kinase RsbW